jgi:polyisoprenoid-binding protein YceI
MNSLTHEALKAKENPNIDFVLTRVNSLKDDAAVVEGMMSIAGKSKNVVIVGRASLIQDEKVSISGEYTLNQTDYGIEPVTAMLGAIKVGDQVTIKFNLIFIK